MNAMKHIYRTLVVGAAALFLPSTAFGQGTVTSQVNFVNPLSFGGQPVTSADTLFQALVNLISQVAVVAAVLMYIYAGFLYVSARGDEKKVGEAHKVFKNTTIGTAILLSAWLIYTILAATIKAITTQAGA